MTTKKYDLVINIGRMQPCHLGHLKNLQESLGHGDTVLVLLGSSFQPRTPKNPFTFEERKMMLRSSIATMGLDKSFDRKKIVIKPLRDYLYSDNQWIEEVQRTVNETLEQQGIKSASAKIAILGHEKDDSSYYLRLFPNWDFIDTGPYAEVGGMVVDATRIRSLYFEGHYGFIKGVVTDEVYKSLMSFSEKLAYTLVREEYDFYKKYEKQWENTPYKVQFNTADAVVVQGGHVALVQRRSSPGKGLWAIPGGFININETSREAAIRELLEETKIKVPEKVLRNSITYDHLFDHPKRSLRGRTFTTAYLIELNSGDTALPKLKGSDDAAKARWFSLADVSNMSEVLFEDHYSILMHMKQRLV